MTDQGCVGLPTLPSLREDRGLVDVLVIGAYFCDIVYSGLHGLPQPGDEMWAKSCAIVPGGTYITAAALHRLGVSSAWACQFGTDPFSRFTLEAARKEGIDPSAFVEIDRELRNISVSLSFGTDRSFVSYADPVTSVPIDAILRLRPRVVMWPGFGRIGELEHVLQATRKVGAILYLDPQSSKHTLASAPVRDLLGRIDVFAPNEREALLLTGLDRPDAALERLIQSSSLVVLKLGADGAVAADRGGRLSVPAIAVRPIETTGAGDCFNAGFVMAMVEGEDIIGCLQAGNAAGALSTVAPSSAGIPVRAAVDSARATYRVAPSTEERGSIRMSD